MSKSSRKPNILSHKAKYAKNESNSPAEYAKNDTNLASSSSTLGFISADPQLKQQRTKSKPWRVCLTSVSNPLKKSVQPKRKRVLDSRVSQFLLVFLKFFLWLAKFNRSLAELGRGLF